MAGLIEQTNMFKFVLDTYALGGLCWKDKNKWESETWLRNVLNAMHLNVAVIMHSAGVPIPKPDLKARNKETALGMLEFGSWEIWINVDGIKKELKKASGKTGDNKKKCYWKLFAEAADTIYHESRHAEQWFHIGRLLGTPAHRGGLGFSRVQIQKCMGIPAEVARAAKNQNLLDGPAQESAEKWCKSIYPECLPDEKLDKVLEIKMKATTAKDKSYRLRKKINQNPLFDQRSLSYAIGNLKRTGGKVSDAVQERSNVSYHSLAEEEDAHFCGGTVKKGIYQVVSTKIVNMGAPNLAPHPNRLRAQMRNRGKVQ